MSIRRRVWQVRSLKRGSICTLSRPLSLCLILSVSAARLIHLQLSRLVEQVRGNVVPCPSLNPLSGPADCGGSDRWCRVTWVSRCLSLFERSLCPLANKLMLRLGALLHPDQTPRGCQLRSGHLCLQCHWDLMVPDTLTPTYTQLQLKIGFKSSLIFTKLQEAFLETTLIHVSCVSSDVRAHNSKTDGANWRL